MKMLNVIYAEGSLKKFLIARAMGAPEDELKALASAAAAEGNRDRSIGSEGKLSGVVIHLDRVKRKQKEVMDDDQCAAQARVWKIIPED